MLVTVTVSPDGAITFPYIGTVRIKGMTLAQAQEDIQSRLADGYMKYPVVSIALRQSMSEKFFVYGEVMRPGTYRLESKMTVLKAISLAGGFTKFGSSSRVKVLRTKDTGEGYDVIKVNLNAAMNGSFKDDVVLKQGDIVVVSEGIF
jgi:polysaccharide export outer membrane protein